ncbi:FKBP-type peptidyl-prolyl cis-trans isomerase [Flavobacterium branchiicola]|uniref:peptidylprolyl isomerase n=1 Tax=Flavobacterium branchiicola TaxID=1114875 RepID=A0ABV9PG34_9FLAO|nr:FKBP-type peptidyl-prolyl cis-trans isomerase [Flavobacterium branchiicola]MBS7255726.1 FKBP-type peptidyl-prolyl cis-trans isomerase [Flavobacterium branchiicola]
MNKFKYYFVLLLAGIAIVSCNKKDDDEVVVVPLRDYTEQYKADNDSITKYLKTHYIKEVTADFDITFEKIPAGGAQVSVWDQQDYPLQNRDVYNDDITYKVYYLVLNEGVGQNPINTDRINASYVGSLLNGTVFDTSNGIPITFDLFVYDEKSVIEGWAEIFPKFKTGNSTTDASGVVTYNNFGAGVMFLPSGLGYYASGQTDIPAYSPLMFSFKLMGLARWDHDKDGVFDYNEDVNGDGYTYNLADKVKYPNPPAALKLVDDTDGDGTPDFLDIDDDGDGYTTLFEITKPTGAPVTGISKYYPYDPIPDSPVTPNVDETETWGIPAVLPNGTIDYTTPGRNRLHVDKDHHAIK